MKKHIGIIILVVLFVGAALFFSYTKEKKDFNTTITTAPEDVITQIDSNEYRLTQTKVDRLENIIAVQDSLLAEALSKVYKKDKQIIALQMKIKGSYDAKIDPISRTIVRVDTVDNAIEKVVLANILPIRSKFFDADFLPRGDLLGYKMETETRVSVVVSNKVKRRFFRPDIPYADVRFLNPNVKLVDAENVTEYGSKYRIKPAVFVGYMAIVRDGSVKTGFGLGAGVSLTF
jgi:hypothetical protein